MKTRLRLYNGQNVTVEQTMTGITAHYDGELPCRIGSGEYMRLVMAGSPVGSAE